MNKDIQTIIDQLEAEIKGRLKMREMLRGYKGEGSVENYQLDMIEKLKTTIEELKKHLHKEDKTILEITIDKENIRIWNFNLNPSIEIYINGKLQKEKESKGGWPVEDERFCYFERSIHLLYEPGILERPKRTYEVKG